MKCTADSGAFCTVTSVEVAKDSELVVTEEAKSGMEFTAANGTAIKYYGKRMVNGVSDEGLTMNMEMAVADVKKTLASVGSMCDAGNIV